MCTKFFSKNPRSVLNVTVNKCNHLNEGIYAYCIYLSLDHCLCLMILHFGKLSGKNRPVFLSKPSQVVSVILRLPVFQHKNSSPPVFWPTETNVAKCLTNMWESSYMFSGTCVMAKSNFTRNVFSCFHLADTFNDNIRKKFEEF